MEESNLETLFDPPNFIRFLVGLSKQTILFLG